MGVILDHRAVLVSSETLAPFNINVAFSHSKTVYRKKQKEGKDDKLRVTLQSVSHPMLYINCFAGGTWLSAVHFLVSLFRLLRRRQSPAQIFWTSCFIIAVPSENLHKALGWWDSLVLT